MYHAILPVATQMKARSENQTVLDCQDVSARSLATVLTVRNQQWGSHM